MFQALLSILVSLIIGFVLFSGLYLALRRLGLTRRNGIWIACLLCGLVSGFFTATLWPADSTVLFNLPGSLIGDLIYRGAIQYLGNPVSDQAHYTIPWLLRVPQVYIPASVLIWLLIGLILSSVATGLAHRQRPS